jgi:hypothetical protein
VFLLAGPGCGLAVGDWDRRMTFAYVMNKMGGGVIAAAFRERVAEIVNF